MEANESLDRHLRQIPLHPLTLRSIANAMRLEGSRPQPGLRGSPSDAKHRPETARDVDRQPEMLRSPRLLTTRIERRGAIAMEFATRSDVHPIWSLYPSASCYGIRRAGSQRLDCFVASAFARRRASADKSAPRNDVESIR